MLCRTYSTHSLYVEGKMSYASLISTLPTTLVGGATMQPAQSCCWLDPKFQLSKYRVTGAPQLVGGCHGPDVRVSDNTDEALTIASGKPDPKCLICVPCVTASTASQAQKPAPLTIAALLPKCQARCFQRLATNLGSLASFLH